MPYRVTYRTTTGEILGWHSDDDGAPTSGVFSSLTTETRPDPARHYLAGSPATLTARPASPATLDTATIDADGVATATVSGIPAGAQVTITDPSGSTTLTATGAELEITSVAACRITVAVVKFPHQDALFAIDAY